MFDPESESAMATSEDQREGELQVRNGGYGGGGVVLVQKSLYCDG